MEHNGRHFADILKYIWKFSSLKFLYIDDSTLPEPMMEHMNDDI